MLPNTDDLKYRLSGFCKRTLRKDVTEYIKYTERFPIVKEFSASDEEQQLYDELSAFLQKEESYAIPASIWLELIESVLTKMGPFYGSNG